MWGLGEGERGEGVGVSVSASIGKVRVVIEEGELVLVEDGIPRRRE